MSEFDRNGGCNARGGLHCTPRWRKVVISTAAILSVATAARADELPNNKTQSEQIREQNDVLAKRVVELEKRLRKLEAQPAKPPVVATRSATTANPAAPLAGNYNKAPSIRAVRFEYRAKGE
jgi:RNA processing factor Prp31